MRLMHCKRVEFFSVDVAENRNCYKKITANPIKFQHWNSCLKKARIASNRHNRLNVRRIALERFVGALISCNLLRSVGEGEPKLDKEVQ